MGKQIKYSVPLLKSRQASVEEIEFRTINETRDQAIKKHHSNGEDGSNCQPL